MRNIHLLVSSIVLCFAISGIANTPSSTSKTGLFKPFKSTSQSVRKDESAVIWTRIRKQFSFHVPHDHARVKHYLKRYSNNSVYVNELVNNAYPFLYHIVEEIEKRGLPAELALLPMVESTFDPHAKSSSGAIGLWQIMPSTGKYFGLTHEPHFEACRDIDASTQAALTHLEYLYKRFKGDWLLALAAYNSGEGKVMRAIAKNKQAHKATDFWSLSLPKETTDYIPKLLALVEIVKHPHKHGVKIANIPNKPYFTRIDNDKPIVLDELASQLKIPVQELHRLNPAHVTKCIHPQSPKHLLVPLHVAKDTRQSLKTINKYVPNQPHVVIVKKGDSLSKIAQTHQVSVEAIQNHNKLSGQTIKIGMKLEIPQESKKIAKKITPAAPPAPKVHIVKNGDSLWRISKQYKIPISQIASKNNLSTKATLKPGQQLLIEV